MSRRVGRKGVEVGDRVETGEEDGEKYERKEKGGATWGDRGGVPGVRKAGSDMTGRGGRAMLVSLGSSSGGRGRGQGRSSADCWTSSRLTPEDDHCESVGESKYWWD